MVAEFCGDFALDPQLPERVWARGARAWVERGARYGAAVALWMTAETNNGKN
jgi:hypothetical protein